MESQGGTGRAYLGLTVAAIAWGASFVATKRAVSEVSPATVVWVRFGLGVLVLGAAVAARKQWALPPRRELPFFALLGFLGVAFHQWLQANGLKTASATTSSWIVTTIPIFTALLGFLVLREVLHPVRMAGIALAAAGVLVVVSRGRPGALWAGSAGTVGDLLVLGSAVNWAVFTVLSRGRIASHPPARMMLWVMVLGWALTFPWLLAGPGFSELTLLTPIGWVSLAFLGFVCSGLAYIGYYDALRVLPAARVAAFIYFQPLVTMAVAVALGQEHLVPAALVGGALILGGVALVNKKVSGISFFLFRPPRAKKEKGNA